MKKPWKIILLLILAFLLLTLAACAARTQGPSAAKTETPGPSSQPPGPKEDVTSFYKGKVLEFIVPYGTGGGYDAYARLMARYLEKYTGSTVTVLNKPGGGGLAAISDLYRARPDGLAIAIMNGIGVAQAQLTGDPAAQFDLTKFTWLGSVAADTQVYYVSKASGLTSVEDLLKRKKVKFGATGTGSSTYFNIVMFAEALRPLGLELKLVSGFESSSDIQMAMLRGDIDGSQHSYLSVAKLAKSGDVKVIAQLGKERAPELKDVPLLAEVKGITPEGRKLVDVANLMAAAGRPLAAPPGVPEDRANYLRGAIAKVLADKEFLEEAARQGLPIAPQTAEEVEATFRGLLGISSEVRAAIKEAMEKYRQ